jgi:uncharacterized SAM-binding protein YcdF (DUF218 family)
MGQKPAVIKMCVGVLAIASLLLTSSLTWSQKFTPSPPPAPGKALVYVYRQGSMVGAGGYDRIFVNGEFLAALQNSKYAAREVPEGTVVFAGEPRLNQMTPFGVTMHADSHKETTKYEKLRIEVEAGKTYYIKWHLGKMKLVDAATGSKEIRGLKLARD